MITQNNETYDLVLIKYDRKNCTYDNDHPYHFKGRPANSLEKKAYIVEKGVHSKEEGTYIYATNLPENIDESDRIVFLGENKMVESVGYYFDNTRIVDASIFSDEYIKSLCPKGITIK